MPLIPELIKLVQHLKDPNKQRREEVQNLALQDPKFADRLKTALQTDPKVLDKLYQKHGLEEFLRVQPDSADTVADKARASEANRIRGYQARELLSNPDNASSVSNAGIIIPELSGLNIRPDQAMKPLDDDEKTTLEEFRAKESGTKTKKERELTQSGIDANKQQKDYYSTELDKTKKEQQDKADYTRVGVAAAARVKKLGKTLYEAKKDGTIDAGEITAINAVPALKSQYDNEFEDFWKQQQLNEQKDAHNKTLQEMKAQSEDLLARKTVDETDNAISYDTALKLVRNPQLMAEYSDKKLEDIPNRTPEITQLWKAAQFYKDKAEKVGKLAKAKANLAFQNSASYKKLFGDKKKTDWTQEDIDELNTAAATSFIGEGILDAPQYQLKTTKNKRLGFDALAKDDNTPELITDKTKKKGGANTQPAGTTAGAQADSIPTDFDYASAAKSLKGESDDDVKKELKRLYPDLKDGQLVQMLTRIRGTTK